MNKNINLLKNLFDFKGITKELFNKTLSEKISFSSWEG